MVQEALPVLSRLAPVEFRFDLIGEEEVGEGRVAGAIHGNELAVTADADPPPDAHRRVGAEQARRQLKGHAEDVIVGKKVFAGPAARVRSALEAGEVFAALVVEHVQDSGEVDEESVAAQSEEASVGARGVDVRLGTERHLDVFEDRLPGGLSPRASGPVAR